MKLLLLSVCVALVSACGKSGPGKGDGMGHGGDGMGYEEYSCDEEFEKMEMLPQYKKHINEKMWCKLREMYKMKTALFALQSDWPPYSYYNMETGLLQGFLVDLIKYTCKKGKMMCEIINIGDHLDKCLDEKEFDSPGLFNNYFHACAGWAATYERHNWFNFSVPLMKTPMTQLYKRKGDASVNGYSTGKTVAFRGWTYMGPKCLYRQGHSMDKDKMHWVENYTQAAQMVNDREVDLVMAPEGANGTESLEVVGKPFQCTKGYYMMMHRKDVHMPLFEIMFYNKMVKTGKYQELAYKHGVKNTVDFDELMMKLREMFPDHEEPYSQD